MVYKVLIDKNVIRTLDKIDMYCIRHYGNYYFGKKVLKEIIIVKNNIESNPNLYLTIKQNHHKAILKDVGYNLYYRVDDHMKEIIIYSIRKFKQKQ